MRTKPLPFPASRLIAAGAVIALVAIGAWRWTARRDGFEFFPAAPADPGAPLLILVTERRPVWRANAPGEDAGPVLSAEGVSTALVRIPSAPGLTLRQRAESLAAQLQGEWRAFPARLTARRVVLGGVGAAGDVVAALALDERLRAAAQPGAVGISDVLLLGARFPPDSTHPAVPHSSTLPAILVLHPGDDSLEVAKRARRSARELERRYAAHAEFRVVAGRGRESIAGFVQSNTFARGVAAFVRGTATLGDVDPLWAGHAGTSGLGSLSTAAFAADSGHVRRYPMDLRVYQAIGKVLGQSVSELFAYDVSTYSAVDLRDFLARQSERVIGTGDFLVVSNIRGEQVYLTRAEVDSLRPRVVVGLGDEENLFRLFAPYRPVRRYSWLADSAPMPWMVRPVGGLLHFPDGAPAHFPAGTTVASGLTTASFRWQREDPLRNTRALPAPVQDVLIGESGCLSCHSFRGEGAASRHALLKGPSERGGGAALPLEQYPPRVLHDFLFDQDRVAALFNAQPLRVPPTEAAQLEALVLGHAPRRGQYAP